MLASTNSATFLLVALGIGLLIGAERERRKGTGPARGPAGIRTFALAAFAGGLSAYLDSQLLLAIAAASTIVFSALAYRRLAAHDPGLTTEFALLVTVLLGALAISRPLLAAGLSVLVTGLLAARDRLHRIFRDLLSEREVHDGLIFLAATVVILPLAPNRDLGPFGAFNPYKIWLLVVLVMSISAAGYSLLRFLGPDLGLALAGFFGGFVSSSATIGSLGARVRRNPAFERPATAGAVLSTVATTLQMILVLLVANAATARALALPMALAAVTAIAYAVFFVILSSHKAPSHEAASGRAFDLRLALVFALTVSLILLLCAFLNQTFGSRGLLLAAALSGFADTHATAISMAALVSSAKLTPQAAVLPVLLGFATNSATKLVVAFIAGGYRFGLKIALGLVLVLLAAFSGFWLTVK